MFDAVVRSRRLASRPAACFVSQSTTQIRIKHNQPLHGSTKPCLRRTFWCNIHDLAVQVRGNVNGTGSQAVCVVGLGAASAGGKAFDRNGQL